LLTPSHHDRRTTGKVALGHNGNLTKRANGAASSSIAARSSKQQRHESLVHLIARLAARNLSGAIGDALNQVEGAYSLLVLTQDEAVRRRDPRGFVLWCLEN